MELLALLPAPAGSGGVLGCSSPGLGASMSTGTPKAGSTEPRRPGGGGGAPFKVFLNLGKS